MKRFGNILLGVTSLLPLLGLLFLYKIIASFSAIEQAGSVSPEIEFAFGGTLFLTLALWLMVRATRFYVAWLARTSRLGWVKKARWAVLLTVAAPLAMPVLWWQHFRPTGARGD